MKRNYEISQELSEVESMIVDLEHYIEFSVLNARDGYVAYKKLHNLLLRRRKIKNEQKVVNMITKNYGIADDIKQIEKDTERDYFLSSKEALNYGLIDKILQ